MKRETKKKIKENIYNIPNAFTTVRLLLTFVLVYMIFSDFSIFSVVIVFIIGMLTDTIDGNLARLLNQKTEFGRVYDQIVDRIFMITTIVAIIFHYTLTGILGKNEIMLILIIMLREIVGLPFALIYLAKGGTLTPKATFIAKATTFLQAVAFPMIILKLNIAWPVAILTGIIGLISGASYIGEIRKLSKK